MNEILLVAVLTLPQTTHVVHEVNSIHKTRASCVAEKREQEKISQRVSVKYVCVPRDVN